MTTLEKIKAEINEKISHYEHFSSSNTAHGLQMALDIIDKYAEQEPKVTTTSTDEPMVIQYPQVDGITPTVVKAEQEPRTWNNHQVACLLADMFGDSCACNYNGIDEWLPDLCDFKDTCCPKPVGVACWEQFLKHSRARYCECGYEVR